MADPGFPVGGGGRRPPTRVLFGGNVCKNEELGPTCEGGARRRWPRDPPMFNGEGILVRLVNSEMCESGESHHITQSCQHQGKQ